VPRSPAVKRALLWIGVVTLALVSSATRAAEGAAGAGDVLAGLRRGHPRLLFTNEDLAAAKEAAKSDPLRAALHQRIIAAATAELKTTPITHELIGPRLLDKSRTCIGRVLTCAMAYRLTGDTRFSDRAKHELATAAAFDDWNPSHFLDIAEMSFAFAIGYDWLYDVLTPAERETIKRALMEKSLVFVGPAYAPGGPTDKRVWFVTAHHNWNQVCNGGFLAAGLALADEEPGLAKQIIAGARKSLPLAMAAYQPDGAYPEGPGYWGYGTGYNVLAIAMLESTVGTDLDLSKAPAFDRTVLYRLHVQSPMGQAFNYADGGAGLGAQAEYTWLAHRFHQPIALAHCRALLQEHIERRLRNTETDRFFALHAVWFPTAGTPAATDEAAPLDIRFRGPAELAIFRSAWGDPRALFVGFKAGRNDVNHAHLDLGSFVLDADGVRWSQDIGPDNYNLPGYFGALRWSYYRLNNRGHSTITPGDALQDPKAAAPITAFVSSPSRAFAVADLSNAYPRASRHLLRGIALLDRSRVLVQDEIAGGKSPTPIAWRMITAAKIKIDDARKATLTLNGRKLRAEIIAPATAKFRIESAKPPTSAENQNRDISVLLAEVEAVADDVQLAVLLTPEGDHWPAVQPPLEITPVSAWK
jgi:hypothetical protein